MTSHRRTLVYYARLEGPDTPPILPGFGASSGDRLCWLASFRAAGPVLLTKFAGLLWPPSGQEKIAIHPAALLTARSGKRLDQLDDLLGLDPLVRQIDACAIARRVAAGEKEAAANGYDMVCQLCGCWELHACEGGCYWVDAGLCSACCHQYGINPTKRAQFAAAPWEVEHQ